MNRAIGRNDIFSLRPAARLLALCLFACAACSPVLAGEPSSITRALGLTTSVPSSTPDFIARSRPSSYDYVPVHEPRKLPDGQVMNKADVEAKEKGLDAARRQHDRVAGRRSGPAAERSVAEGMEERKARGKKEEACGLTCDNPAVRPTRR